jgi:hypothetical protein
MSKRFLITIFTLLVIGIAASIAVFLAKGYTFSPQQKRIVGTGIITVTSTPDAASVFIDGHLTTATNATISTLPPKTYTVKVVKEGFIPWERQVEVKEGLVSDLKITLFPAIPTIYPLTFTGVRNPTLSPDGSKLAYVVPVATASASTEQSSSRKKAGVWIWTFNTNQPINFARGAQPHQIAESGVVDYSNSLLHWSPDSKQVLATVNKNNYLLNDDSSNTDPRDVTAILDSTLKGWNDEIKTKDSARLLTIKDGNVRNTASSSAILRWSPDETKILYRKDALSEADKKPNSIIKGVKVYDLETNQQYDIPEARNQSWLPDSRHIVLLEQDKISIVDFDGTNKAVIYGGKFEDNFVFAWPDSSRLAVISSFPTPTASEPNLYGINLK